MKQVLLSAAVFALTATAFAQKKIADVARFATETIDFGKIKQNAPQKGTFIVTNIGNEPLIIEQANPTCGCTISDYTKEPIAPGKTGVINATYNAAAVGHFEKHLTVKFAGVTEMKSITFVGDVLAADQFDKDKTEEPTKAIAPAVKERDTPADVAVPVKSKAAVKTKSAATLKKVPAKSATKVAVKN
jgi:Protein of unknown function (DUF1573)